MKAMYEEEGVLRWGGLAGILSGIIFIIVIVFVGADPAEPEGEVIRFPDIRAARTVENSLYLVVLILWVAHFLALYPHMSLPLRSPTSIMLPGRPPRIRRHSSCCGRRLRAYSMRCLA